MYCTTPHSTVYYTVQYYRYIVCISSHFLFPTCLFTSNNKQQLEIKTLKNVYLLITVECKKDFSFFDRNFYIAKRRNLIMNRKPSFFALKKKWFEQNNLNLIFEAFLTLFYFYLFYFLPLPTPTVLYLNHISFYLLSSQLSRKFNDFN